MSRGWVALVVEEGVRGLAAYLARTVATVLLVAMAIATVVAVHGISVSGQAEIEARFVAAQPSLVVVQPPARIVEGLPTLPWDAEDRLTALPGVVGAAGLSDLRSLLPLTVAARFTGDSLVPAEVQAEVFAASPSLPAVLGITMRAGSWFNEANEDYPVAVVGPGLAARLRLQSPESMGLVYFEGVAFSVVGVMSGTEIEARLLNAFVVPERYAVDRLGLEARARLYIRTEHGAAATVARLAPMVLQSPSPRSLSSEVAGRGPTAQDEVGEAVAGLVVTLAVVAATAALLAVFVSLVASVRERTAEIGLRASLGSSRSVVAMQFMLEGVLIGTLGGAVAAGLGPAAIVVGAQLLGWHPVVNLEWVLLAPIAGLALGLLSSPYPAWRAASADPVEALRR